MQDVSEATSGTSDQSKKDKGGSKNTKGSILKRISDRIRSPGENRSSPLTVKGNLVFDDSQQGGNQSIIEDSVDKQVHILYTNADSLLNKKQELQLRIQEDDPDIIAVVEALPKNTVCFPDEKEYYVKGYHLLTNSNDCRGNNGRGLILLCKDQILMD